MDYLPISTKITGRRVLVVGGGDTAARRVRAVAGAEIHVIAPDLGPGFQNGPKFIHHPRDYHPEDLDGAVLAFAASEDEALDARVSADAQARNIPVNVADRPDLCTFIMPAIVDRTPLTIAISSAGQAPLLARRLRAELETRLPPAYGRLAQLIGDWRQRVAGIIGDPVQRRRFWERVVDGPVAQDAFAGRAAEAERQLADMLQAAREGADTPPAGEVYIVGCGPGDPDLLTFRALRLMQQADVVLHDRLVPEAILDLVRREARRIYVGKQGADHAVPQGEITKTLVELARKGNRVLRLKSGDPFVFGRGGEEIEEAAGAGIAFQVVPGVTAATGCAAYAGIPLTHRDYADACILVTGHERDGRLDLNWTALVQPRQTVVVYMGLKSLARFAKQMTDHGADASLSVAVIENGTRQDQRIVTGRLSDIAGRIREADIDGPSIVIVGHVVELHDRLSGKSPR